jgi:hypothetical protein
MLNSGNEPKDLLKRKELAFFWAKNELVLRANEPPKGAKKPPFCVESKSNSRVEGHRRAGRVEGGYTSCEFDVGGH